MKLALIILTCLFIVVSAIAQPTQYPRMQRIFQLPAGTGVLAEHAREAANSIAAFIVEQNNFAADAGAAQPHVLPAALPDLRRPPRIPGDPSRTYTAVEVSGWRVVDPARLAFTIEYANPKQPRSRYLEHYVFVRQGDAWLFEKHGDAMPRHWEVEKEGGMVRQ